MPSLNRVQLIGYLVREPETRVTQSGKKVCHFRIAVARQGSDDPDWFRIQAWGRLGEVCQQYLANGRLVFIEGELHTDRWLDEKHVTQYRTYVVARGMQILDRKPGEEEVAAESEAEEPAGA